MCHVVWGHPWLRGQVQARPLARPGGDRSARARERWEGAGRAGGAQLRRAAGSRGGRGWAGWGAGGRGGRRAGGRGAAGAEAAGVVAQLDRQ